MPKEHYDEAVDLELKDLGYKLFLNLTTLMNDQDTWKVYGDATSLIKSAIGFLPMGDGPNSKSDSEVLASIPRVQGMIQLVEALLRARDI